MKIVGPMAGEPKHNKNNAIVLGGFGDMLATLLIAVIFILGCYFSFYRIFGGLNSSPKPKEYYDAGFNDYDSWSSANLRRMP